MTAELEGWLESTFDRLFPICRSIMGPGFRQSLEKHLAELRPFVLLPATAGAFADTVAVKVTLSPNTVGLFEVLTAVVVVP